MHTSTISITIRTAVVLGFLIVMPVLALPPVGNWVDHVRQSIAFGAAAQSQSATWSAKPQIERQTVLVNSAEREAAVSASIAEAAPRLDFRAAMPPQHASRDEVVTLRSREQAEQQARRFREAAIARSQFIQERLKQMGAAYMILERAPPDGAAYRFHCQMPIAGSDTYTRPFEVTAPDAIQAMERVLADVESWFATQPHSTAGFGPPQQNFR